MKETIKNQTKVTLLTKFIILLLFLAIPLSQTSLVRAQTETSFSSFSAKVETEIGSEITENKLEAKGSFTLGQKSDGIDPLNEAVTVKIGNFEKTIPVGSFK